MQVVEGGRQRPHAALSILVAGITMQVAEGDKQRLQAALGSSFVKAQDQDMLQTSQNAQVNG